MNKNNISYVNKNFSCNQSLVNDIIQELFKRFYKPLYIPLIAILCCFLIIMSKNNIKYEKNKKIIFLITFFILIISEASLRYSTTSVLATSFYLLIPWVSFFCVYTLFYKRTQNV